MSRIIFKIILVLVVIAAFLGLGIYAYQIGMSQGAVNSGVLSSGQGPVQTAPYYGAWYWPPFYGFGFLSCLIPIFLFFLLLAAIRGLFWHGRSGWMRWHHGPWGYPRYGDKTDWKQAVPPMVAEWHRKLHEEGNAQSDDQPGSQKV